MSIWKSCDLVFRWNHQFSSSHIRTLSSSVVLYKKLQKLKLNSGSSQSVKSVNTALVAAKIAASRERFEVRQRAMEELALKKPNHDVYFTNLYAPQLYSIEDIVVRHREFVADPHMLAMPNAVLWARFTLNCRTNKKNRFIHQLPLVFLLPKASDVIPPKNILAFCTEVGDIAAALEAGAFDAGGKELVAKVETGHHNYEAFDYVVCHKDMISAVSKLRTSLRDKMPLLKTEQVGTDMGALVKLYREGVVANMTKSEAIPQIGYIKVNLGTINLSIEDIKANFEACCKAILQSGARKVQGNLIEGIVISCPPSDESFHVKLDFLDNLIAVDSPSTPNADEEESVQPLEDA